MDPSRRTLLCAFVILVLAGVCRSKALADVVHLKGGRSLTVEECRTEGAELRCRRAGGVIGFPLAQVEKIVKQARPPGRRFPPALRRTAPAPGVSGSAPLQPVPPDSPAPVPEAMTLQGGEPTPEEVGARVDALTISLAAGGADTAAARRELSLLYTFLGNKAMLARDYQGAEAHYVSALTHDPNLTVARLNLSTVLITLDRHESADAVLRNMLSEQPDNARALELLGESAFQTGRLDEAIGLWERSLAQKPGDGLQARLAKVRRLRQAEEGFNRSDAAHFALKFDGGEASHQLAQEILSGLEESYSDLSTRFGHHPGAVIQVILYSRKAFQEATSTPDWVGGLFDGQIRIPIGGLTHLTPQARRVLIHELTHCFVAGKTRGNAPQWIQEGIAQVVEGKTAAGSRAALRQAYLVLGGPSAVAEFSYSRALSQVEFFLETWSDSHFNDLLDHLGRGSDIDSAMKAVTGQPYRDFVTAWGEWLAR